MTTKKGIKIIRYLLPDLPLKYTTSTNLAWNGMYSLPSGIAVKNDLEIIDTIDTIDTIKQEKDLEIIFYSLCFIDPTPGKVSGFLDFDTSITDNSKWVALMFYLGIINEKGILQGKHNDRWNGHPVSAYSVRTMIDESIVK